MLGMKSARCLILTALALGCSKTVTTNGVPNLELVECRDASHQVVPPNPDGTCPAGATGIWRSGQPTTPEQWSYLKALGVRTVIKLNFESEGSDQGATDVGLDVHVLSIQPEGDKDILENAAGTRVRPDIAKVAEAERLMAIGGGVLVHCTHGQDRTGLIVGIHRILHDGVSKAVAHDEMVKHNFHDTLHGLHEFWEDFDGKQLPAK
jgi:protein tyrosine/serine phosphatase